MTKEEAEKYIRSKMCNACSVYLGGGKCSYNCKVIEAIESLEQENILDKIRVEIESAIQEETVMVNPEARNGYESTVLKLDPDDVFQIIDKYKRD